MNKRGMNKKGISPVIASILLIALVLVIALIIFFWIKSMNQEAVSKFDKNIELVCPDIEFSASYSSSGKLQLVNNGNVPIYIFNLEIYDSSTKKTITKEIDDIVNDWPTYGLQAGKSASYSAIDELDGATRLTLIPVLKGSTESGEKEYVCDKQYGKEIEL